MQFSCCSLIYTEQTGIGIKLQYAFSHSFLSDETVYTCMETIQIKPPINQKTIFGVGSAILSQGLLD